MGNVNNSNEIKSLMLIGESGGTKTDWCLVIGTKKRFFTTASYHPRNFTEEFIVEQQQFWKQFPELINCQIFFYGSGCYKSEAQAEMFHLLSKVGLHDSKVYSDILGASIAMKLNGNWGAIAGTGSVVFKADSYEVFELIGGKGRDLGDEGSGYYFGKLLLEALSLNQIDPSINATVKERIKNREISEFPKLLYDFKKNKSILQLHKNNVSLFVEKHLINITEINFCGSYAFYHKEIFTKVLKENGINAGVFIDRPLQHILEFQLGE